MKRILSVMLALALAFSLAAVAEEAAVTELKRGSRGEDVQAVQTRLKELGYYSSSIDGDFGKGTEAAVKCFEIANGYSSNGALEENEKAWLYSPKALALLSLASEVKAPNGLPGFKVSEGGNYSDASGQMWLCDTLDRERNLYFRRVGQIVLNGSTPLVQNGSEKKFYVEVYNMKKNADYQLCMAASGLPVASAHTFAQDEAGISGYVDSGNKYPGRNWVYLGNGVSDTVELMSAWLDEHPVMLVYALENPVSGALTEELTRLYGNIR